MRELGRWLREDADRFPMLTAILSAGGLMSIVLGAIFGSGHWGTGFSASAFLMLLVLVFVYARGASR